MIAIDRQTVRKPLKLVSIMDNFEDRAKLNTKSKPMIYKHPRKSVPSSIPNVANKTNDMVN